MRLREVVYHHVDLDAGFSFERRRARPAGQVHRGCRAAAQPVPERPPGVTLRADEGGSWVVGDGAAVVTGSRAGLLLWLARRIPDGVASEGPLPELPRGA